MNKTIETTYWENGNIADEIEVIDGLRNGLSKFYFHHYKNKIQYLIWYKKGKQKMACDIKPDGRINYIECCFQQSQNFYILHGTVVKFSYINDFVF